MGTGGTDQKSREEQLDVVKYCRVDQCYKSGKHKITLYLDPGFAQLQKLVVSCLVQLGGVRKQGRPPKGGVERDLEGWLRDLQMQ